MHFVGGAPWVVRECAGPAAELHAASAAAISGDEPAVRTIALMRPTRPALVLGSGQSEDDVDESIAAARGCDVARRRSGGGAVLVGAGEVLWVDLVLPAADPLWDADVGRSAWWLGELWSDALDDIGCGPTSSWKGPLQKSEWSAQVCFAGLGPGEVLTEAGKVFGVSQRRTRHATLFQTATLLRWQAGELVELLRLDPERTGRPAAEMSAMAVGIGDGRATALWDAVLGRLMT